MLRSFRPYGIVFSTGTLPPGLQSLSNAYTLYCRAVSRNFNQLITIKGFSYEYFRCIENRYFNID
jgi:hypothetical protein